ncbi:MAG: hypothetical protein Q8878_08870, partial [Bacillota bacterium]|nr:hypothetical protein [Bacillota bacterium]
MTFRNSFFDTALIKDKLKKSSWILTLYSIILFFAVTVANAMLIQNIKMEYANASEPEKTDRILKHVNSMISLNNEFVKIIIVIFAVVSALTAFYYINSKKQVDFYHSLPLCREKLFFISFEAGILYFVLPYIVNVFLTLLILAGSGLFGYLSIGSMTANVLINLLYYLAIYSVSVFACVLCGNAIVAILGSCVLLAYFPALIFVVFAQLKSYYRTFYSSCYSVTAMVRNASPAFDFLLAAPRGVGVFRIIAYLFFTAVLIAASAVLYKKRPSEAAGHAMAFRISMP